MPFVGFIITCLIFSFLGPAHNAHVLTIEHTSAASGLFSRDKTTSILLGKSSVVTSDETTAYFANLASSDIKNISNITESTDETSGTQRSGQITEEMFNDFRVAIWYGFIPPIMLVGIIGNFLGLCFLYNSGKLQQTFHLYLFALMFVDIIYLLIMVLSDSLIIMERFNKQFVDYLMCFYSMDIRTVQSLTYSTCAHLITAMSFERLTNIVFPLQMKAFSRKYVFLTILFIFVLNITLLMPAFLMVEGRELTDPTSNDTKCMTVPTQFGKGFRPFSKYYVAIMLAVARFIPGTATLISNIVISIYLVRRSSRRAALFAGKSSKTEYEQFKTTITLMVLSIALLLSLVPSAMTAILSNFYPELYGSDGTLYFTYRFVQDLGYCLRVINASNDFILYIVLSKEQRRAFIIMFKSACGIRCTSEKAGVTSEARENLDGPCTFDNEAFDRLDE